MKQFLFVAACALIGNMIVERWVLKSSEEDPTGFVPVADGIGADDGARAAGIATVYFLGKKFLGGFAG